MTALNHPKLRRVSTNRRLLSGALVVAISLAAATALANRAASQEQEPAPPGSADVANPATDPVVGESTRAQPQSAAPAGSAQSVSPNGEAQDQQSPQDSQSAQESPRANSLALGTQAAWLAARFEAAAKLSSFAVERISDPGVRQYAQQDAQQLRSTAREIRQLAPAPLDRSESATGTDVDLSETVSEIGEAVQDRLRERAKRAESATAEDNSRPLRRGRSTDAVTGDRRTSDADRPGRLRRERRNDQADVGRQRVADGGNSRGLQDRSADRPRVLLPALRENLPEALELVGEAIEDNVDPGTKAWIQHQQAVLNRTLDVKKRELAGFHGTQLDQAYLGMALLANLELGAAAEVVAERVEDGHRSQFVEIGQSLRHQVQEGHRLMAQPQLTSGAASSQRSGENTLQQDTAGETPLPGGRE